MKLKDLMKVINTSNTPVQVITNDGTELDYDPKELELYGTLGGKIYEVTTIETKETRIVIWVDEVK